MFVLQSLITPILAASSLPLVVTARECYTNETKSDGERVFTATSPDQLRIFDGCTKLDGSILIDPSFPGSFVLRNATEITGSIATYGNDSTLEAIELPDLKEIVALGVYNDKGLKRLLLPRLEAIGMGTLALPADAVVDLGALKWVYWLIIGAPWANLSLPALEEAAEDFLIGDNLFDPELIPRRDPVPVDIQLPALREAERLEISALVKSFAIPKLEVIGSEGMKVAAGYADLPSIDLPSLHTLQGRLSLSGHIKRINLGTIKETNHEININSETPVEIDSALTKIGKLNITGAIKALNFEALPYVKTLIIEPSTQGQAQAHCSPSIIELYRFRYRPREAAFCDSESLRLAGPNPWAGYSSPTPSSSSVSTPTPKTPAYAPSKTPTATPTPTPSPGASGRPELGSAAEVVILGAFGLIAIVSIVWFWMHGGKTNNDGDEEFLVEKSARSLSFAEKEGLGSDNKEKHPLLQGDLEEEEEGGDAPPPYTKHLRG